MLMIIMEQKRKNSCESCCWGILELPFVIVVDRTSLQLKINLCVPPIHLGERSSYHKIKECKTVTIVHLRNIM